MDWQLPSCLSCLAACTVSACAALRLVSMLANSLDKRLPRFSGSLWIGCLVVRGMASEIRPN